MSAEVILDVWLTNALGQRQRAGRLAVTAPDAKGALSGGYRYAGEYLRTKDGFDLDPANLPRTEGLYPANDPRSGLHGVFRDALPDDWGKRLLARLHKLPWNAQRPPQLLTLLGPKTLGALAFAPPGEAPAQHQGGVDLNRLGALMQAARRIDQHIDAQTLALDEAMALLLRAGSSAGGARPKALVSDGVKEYIAKFAAFGDGFDVVALEGASMALAGVAGLEVPATRVVEVGGEKALLVERFDFSPGGGRYHMLSFQSLLDVDGWYNLGYADLARPLRRYSSRPQEDLVAFFRQAAFNAAIGNTDDHLKNFSMLHDEGGWRLTPAYDLLPNIAGSFEHVLSFGPAIGRPGREQLMALGAHIGLSNERAEHVLSEVLGVVSDWRSFFASHGVPEQDCKRLAPDIEARLLGLKGRSGGAEEAPVPR